ncbi:MAG: polysaccharide biosynthesis C-terminal domain-containing protein [Prolixibacteraceae bacterium]|nr:polysaccharide biosynthesis C-terminal domain-containing protein [Prolixibacteraceae bacterium]
MKRKFVTNLILLVILNLLIKPFWIFGIDRVVQNVVGAESYGMYFALLNFSWLLNILLDVGITNYNNRNIARHRFLLQKHLPNIVGLRLWLAVGYAAVCFGTGAIIGYDSVQLHLLIFLVINQFLVSFTLYLRSNLSALMYFRTDSLLSVLDRTFMIIICSILLFTNITGGVFRIEWFVYAQTAAYVLTALITLAILISKTGRFSIKSNCRFSLVFLKKSYPYALLILLMAFYNRIDSVLLERLLPDPTGKQEAGIYAQAFRLFDAVSMFGALVAGLLLPIFARMIKKREPIEPIIELSVSLLFVPSVIVAVSSLLYNHDIMGWLYHSHINDSANIFGLLMVGFTGVCMTYIFGTLLTASGRIRELNIMAACGMVFNVAINLLLIPHFQALGAATVSMLTQLLTGVAQIVISIRLLKLKIQKKYILKLLLFIVIIVILGFLSNLTDNRIAGYCALILTSLLIAFAAKLINLRDLYGIITDKE